MHLVVKAGEEATLVRNHTKTKNSKTRDLPSLRTQTEKDDGSQGC